MWGIIEDLQPDILIGDLNADQSRKTYEGDKLLEKYLNGEMHSVGEGHGTHRKGTALIM